MAIHGLELRKFHYTEFYKWIFNQNCLFSLVVLFSIVFRLSVFFSPLFRLLGFLCISFLFTAFLFPIAFSVSLFVQLIHSIRSIWLVFQFYCAFSPHIVIQNWWKGSWDTNWKFSLDVFCIIFSLSLSLFRRKESFRMCSRSLILRASIWRKFQRHDNKGNWNGIRKMIQCKPSLRWFKQHNWMCEHKKMVGRYGVDSK